MNIAAWAKSFYEKVNVGIQRFPVTMGSCVTVVILLIMQNHEWCIELWTMEQWMRLLMAVALFIPVSLCLKMLWERKPVAKRREYFLYLGAAVTVFFYIFILLIDTESTKEITRYMVLMLSFYLVFTLLPYWFKRENYECYLFTLINKFCLVSVYAITLYLGILAMLFTIKSLFSVDISGKLYFDIAALLFGIFAPAFFLAETPKTEENLSPGIYTKWNKILILNLIIPLLIAYTGILYAYFCKILVTVQWPAGIVAHLVLWYSLLSTVVLFFVAPLQTEKPWLKRFSKIFPLALLLPLAMMFISLGIRINAYGVTESRYLVLLTGLWVTGYMLYLGIVKQIRNIFLVAALVGVLLLTVCGGPLSCYSVTINSQNMRLTKILNHNGMLHEGKIVPASGEISEKDKQEIREIIKFFGNRSQLHDLAYVPEDFEIDRMQDVFGFKLYNNSVVKEKEKEIDYSIWSATPSFCNIKEYDYFLVGSNLRNNEINFFEQCLGGVTVSLQENQIVVSVGEEILYRNNLEELVRKIHQLNEREKQNLQGTVLWLTDEQGSLTDKIEVAYFFKEIRGRQNESTQEIKLQRAEYFMYIKLNDGN